MCLTTTAAAVDPPITAVHPDIIQSHILKRLDGPTLAATSCASVEFLSLCSDDRLWREICNSTWPSTAHPAVRDAVGAFPSGHRSFYSDAFPAAGCRTLRPGPKKSHRARAPHAPELISAVDIYFDDELIYSKVSTTDTLNAWFQSSPFRIDLLEPKETVATPLKYDGEDGACMGSAEARLRISWILIDPSKKRAVNVASRNAVEARRHWLTEDIQLRYATVVGGGDGEPVKCGVTVACGGEEGGELRVKEVSMQLEDMEGRILTGRDSLAVLEEAMEGQRWKSDHKSERDIYEKYLRLRIQCRERKLRRERSLDMVCIATGVSIFVAIWVLFLSR